MWALRRAPFHLKNQRFRIGSSQVTLDKLDTSCNNIEEKVGISECYKATHQRCASSLRFCCAKHSSPNFCCAKHSSNCCCAKHSSSNFCCAKHSTANFSSGRHALSSQAGAESSDDDLEDGFSDLENPTDPKAVKANNSEEELLSEPELSGDEDETEETPRNELELLDTESSSQEKNLHSFELFKAIISTPGNSVSSALQKFVDKEKVVSQEEISHAMLNLRKRRMFRRALQLSEWLESNKKIDFGEKDHASRLDLVAKVHGIQSAQSYIQKIPKSFRGEIVYRTLLANCVATNHVKKSEEVFNKMRDLEFPLTSFACNQLLLLYKRLDKKKIADVLLLMEKENVKPSLFTYKLLIDTKGSSNDIPGMDQIVETMNSEGVKPDIHTQSILAKHYAAGGLTEKAVAVLKEMEGDSAKVNRWATRYLLPLYAELGKADDVKRIWDVCESKPRIEECTAAIEAWGKLKKIEEAEAVFERMVSTWKKLSSKHFGCMLKVYANHKLISKGKDVVKRMADSGCVIGPLTWDAIVKLYLGAGEVEKADSILEKASKQNQKKPLFNSYMSIMDQYARRGDIHNAEKIFHRMRQNGYVGRIRQYQALTQTYIIAKAPAYGMRERLKADNLFPNTSLAAQLAQVDAFRKTQVSDLLD